MDSTDSAGSGHPSWTVREQAVDLVHAIRELWRGRKGRVRRAHQRVGAGRLAMQRPQRARDAEIDVRQHEREATVAGVRQEASALERRERLLRPAVLEIDVTEHA